MGFVALLDLSANETLSQHRHFHAVFVREQVELRTYTARSDSDLPAFLEEASALLVWSDAFLLTSEHTDLVRSAVFSGKRLLMRLNPNSLSLHTRFLQPFGIEPTSIGLASEHGSELVIDRALDPDCFQDEELLNDVNAVTIWGPRFCRYTGEAAPILSAPRTDMAMVDYRTDFRAQWPQVEMPLLLRSKPIGSRGELVVVPSGALFDPYQASGKRLDGIVRNQVLAANLVRWLGGAPETPAFTAARGFHLIDRIERILCDVLQTILRAEYGDAWYDRGITDRKTRELCENRARQESNRFMPQAYLDLSHIGKALTIKQKLFTPYLDQCGSESLRDISTTFDRLNLLRRLVMHPTRRHFSGHHLEEEDLVFLSQTLSWTECLRSASRIGAA